MKSIAISGSPRENVGKRDAKTLRYEGKVPAVLYGGTTQVHFSVSATDLQPLIYTPEVQFVDLEIGGVKARAILQDVQFHPLREQILHADFLRLQEGSHITMQIPIKLTGTSPGVRAGGKLIQKLRKLRVKALPEQMPQVIEISLEPLEVGKSVRVAALKFDNIQILNNADDTIVSVITSRGLKEAAAAEGKK